MREDLKEPREVSERDALENVPTLAHMHVLVQTYVRLLPDNHHCVLSAKKSVKKLTSQVDVAQGFSQGGVPHKGVHNVQALVYGLQIHQRLFQPHLHACAWSGLSKCRFWLVP